MSYYVRAAFVCGVCLEKLHGTKKDGFLPESHRIGSMCFQVICDFIIRQRNTSFRQMPGDFARAVAEGVLLADKDFYLRRNFALLRLFGGNCGRFLLLGNGKRDMLQPYECCNLFFFANILYQRRGGVNAVIDNIAHLADITRVNGVQNCLLCFR